MTPLLSSDLLLAFMYEMTRFSSDNAQDSNNRGGGRERGYYNESKLIV